MTSTDPLDLAAGLLDLLAPEHVEPAEELALPDWTPDLVLDDDGLAEVDGALGPERVRPRWRVDTDERADYALRRVAMASEEIARVLAFADQQRAQIDAFVEARLKEPRGTVAFFTGAAADYARRLREADPKFRTLPLPCGGKLTAHDGRDGVEVEDEEKFTTWALEQGHDNVVRVKYEAVKAEIPKRYTVDGERFVHGEPDEREVVPGLFYRAKGWTPKATPPPPAP